MTVDNLGDKLFLKDMEEARVAHARDVVQITGTDSVPLSYMQKRLWLIERMNPENSVYNVPVCFEFDGTLQMECLQKSIEQMVRRHEILRTTVSVENEEPIQVVSPEQEVKIEYIDLRLEDNKNTAIEIVRQYGSEKIDMVNGPSVKVLLIQPEDNQYLFLLVTHQLVMDGRSVKIFLEELAVFYNSILDGLTAKLPELKVRYADFVAWEHEAYDLSKIGHKLLYWKQKLTDTLPVLEIPTDYPIPPVCSFNGDKYTIEIDLDLTERLRLYSRAHGVTLFTTLLTAFKILLFYYSQQDTISVATAVSNRSMPGTELLIGPFSNYIVFCTFFDEDLTIRQILNRVSETAAEAMTYQYVPFEILLDNLEFEQDLSRHPIFQAMFTLQKKQELSINLEGIETKFVDLERKTSKFDLSLELDEGDIISGWLEYNTDLYKAETISRMAAHYIKLLDKFTTEYEYKISQISVLSEDEKKKILTAWNNTEVNYDYSLSIPQLFVSQAEKKPESIAVIFGNEQWSYNTLELKSRKIALYLKKLGVNRQSLVGISMGRSALTIAGILGILRAGCVYVPLDPNYPKERTEFIIKDAGLKLVLTDETVKNKSVFSEIRTLCLSDDYIYEESEEDRPLIYQNSGHDAAYVIYTSGSTGKPKGVLGLQKGIVNRCRWMWNKYPFKDGEVCCQKTSLNFVDSVSEIFVPLLHGIPLVVIPEDTVLDLDEFINTIAEKKVSRVVVVPSFLRMLIGIYPDVGSVLPHLKLCITSGEALDINLVNRFVKEVPGCKLLNLYGSTEVAGDVTCFDTGDLLPAQSRVPIGRPIDNTKIYILDRNLNAVPIGVTGEIYVSGHGVAKGYLNRPELTSEKFIQNPYGKDHHNILFRSGDLGRYLTDGTIEYVGREDQQVKIRGIRVELGEVEQAIKGHPEVKEVTVNEWTDNFGYKSLKAYLVLKNKDVTTDELRDTLRKSLPEYAIPSVFIKLDSMPLLPNGKVNRRLLMKLNDQVISN